MPTHIASAEPQRAMVLARLTLVGFILGVGSVLLWPLVHAGRLGHSTRPHSPTAAGSSASLQERSGQAEEVRDEVRDDTRSADRPEALRGGVLLSARYAGQVRLFLQAACTYRDASLCELWLLLHPSIAVVAQRQASRRGPRQPFKSRTGSLKRVSVLQCFGLREDRLPCSSGRLEPRGLLVRSSQTAHRSRPPSNAGGPWSARHARAADIA